MARNLYVAVQPTVADAGWLTSRMDFRSNEAGRTVPGRGTAPFRAYADFLTGRSNSATDRGRRSFVTHHES
jgi:hypothetical protein